MFDITKYRFIRNRPLCILFFTLFCLYPFPHFFKKNFSQIMGQCSVFSFCAFVPGSTSRTIRTLIYYLPELSTSTIYSPYFETNQPLPFRTNIFIFRLIVFKMFLAIFVILPLFIACLIRYVSPYTVFLGIHNFHNSNNLYPLQPL